MNYFRVMELSEIIDKAFNHPIKDGNARILLKLQPLECEVENSAPDFISVQEDEVFLKIQPTNESNLHVEKFDELLPLKLLNESKEGTFAAFEFEEGSIWFDIDVEFVKDIWIDDLMFSIESKNPRYLAYYIKSLDHQLEWLQPDIRTKEIQSMSISTKKFKPPKISGKETFTSKEVIRCADMLARSIKKIDLRTGGAFIKLNTDKGRLEPLIISVAEKLGYIIEPLDKNDIASLEAKGKNVSHSIYLRRI